MPLPLLKLAMRALLEHRGEWLVLRKLKYEMMCTTFKILQVNSLNRKQRSLVFFMVKNSHILIMQCIIEAIQNNDIMYQVTEEQILARLHLRLP